MNTKIALLTFSLMTTAAFAAPKVTSGTHKLDPAHTKVGPAPKFTSGTYKLDPAHTKVGFEIAHLVISSVEGKFTKFDGSINLNDKFEQSSLKANADVGSIDTGIAKRDDHLRSADFFDAQNNPQMTFESTEMKGKPESFKMTGNLKIKNVTKKVTFDGKLLGTIPGTPLKVAFTAKTKINRKDFGLTWNKIVEAGPAVGEEVTIDLKGEAEKQ